jgi:hypothetical protein
LLTADERDAVLGDLYEQQATFRQEAYELLVLAIHRQCSQWRRRQPWLVLFCIVAPVGIVLSRITYNISGFLVMQLWTRQDSGDWYHSALSGRLSLIAVMSIGCAAAFSAWCTGVVISGFSRVTLAVSAFVLYGFWLARGVNSCEGTAIGLYTMAGSAVLFVLPSCAGMLFAFSSLSRRRVLILLVSAALAVFGIWSDGWFVSALERWSSGTLHGQTIAMRTWPFTVSILPAFYLFLSTAKRNSANG